MGKKIPLAKLYLWVSFYTSRQCIIEDILVVNDVMQCYLEGTVRIAQVQKTGMICGWCQNSSSFQD